MDDKPITPFDDLITPSSLQLLKLFIPYIPPDQQKTFAVFEKYLELKSTIDFFQSKKNAIHIQSETENNLSFSSILDKITPYLSSKDQEMINSLSNAMNMMEMFQEFQNMEGDDFGGGMDEEPKTEEYGSKETDAD